MHNVFGAVYLMPGTCAGRAQPVQSTWLFSLTLRSALFLVAVFFFNFLFFLQEINAIGHPLRLSACFTNILPVRGKKKSL